MLEQHQTPPLPDKLIDFEHYSEAAIVTILDFLDFVEEVYNIGLTSNNEIALPEPSDLNGVFIGTLTFLNQLRDREVISAEEHERLFTIYRSFHRQLVY